MIFSMRTSSLSFALGVVLSLLPSASFASSTASTVAVPLAPNLERETATIGYALESVVRQSHRVELVDLTKKAEGEAAVERQQALERARELYQRGDTAYNNFEFTEASHAFEDAIAAFEQTDLTVAFPELLEAYAMMATTAYFNGDVPRAQRIIGRLLALRNNFVFDGRRFPPDFREEAESLRLEIEQESRSPLEIIVDPVPARVYVNGVFRGISPLEIRNLPPAEHHVSVVALGYGLLQERGRAGPGAMMRLTLPRAAEGAAIGQLLKNLESRLSQGHVSEPGAAIANWGGVDEVLTAGVTRAGGGQLRVVMARVATDGHVLAVGEKALALEDSAALSELAMATAELYREDIPRGPNAEPIPRDIRIAPAFSRATLGFAVVGTGVAAGIGGAIMGLRAQSTSTSAKEIPQRRQEEISDAIASAKRQALIADILYGTAFVGTVAGLYLAMPALKPEAAEPRGRGVREDWYALMPMQDGAVLMVGGRF